jgi:hypothetical protein
MVNEETSALVPIQLQDLNSRVLKVDSQLSRRCDDSVVPSESERHDAFSKDNHYPVFGDLNYCTTG